MTSTASSPARAALPERTSDHPIEPLFLARWSPRAFDGEAMPQADLETILEAARWAPSSFNAQPWRFAYAHRASVDFARFLELLLPFNAAWASRAAVLVFVASDRYMTDADAANAAESHSHSFDAGAAWAHLALQTTALGYHAHAMTGVDFPRAANELGLPDRYRLEAAVALGRRADASVLTEKVRAREMPSGRKPLGAIAGSGCFPNPD